MDTELQNKQIEMVFNIGNKKQNSNNLKIIENKTSVLPVWTD